MTTFWIFAALVVVPGLLFLLPALLKPKERITADLNQRNITIARERLAELENERQQGLLSDSAYEQTKTELEATLLDDLREEQVSAEAVNKKPALVTALVVVLLAPLLAIVLYMDVGSPGILEKLASGAQAQQGQGNSPHSGSAADAKPSMDELLQRLAAKLEKDPNNAEGWFILGRSYMSERRYAEAIPALEKAHELIGDHPNVLTSLADAVAMGGGGKISGRAEGLLKKALELESNNVSALWMLGIAMQEQGRYHEALGYWQRAMPLVQDEPEAQARLGSMIDDLKKNSGIQSDTPPVTNNDQAEQPSVVTAASIQVSVSLDDSLKDKVAADDVLFIMAKAVSGPPMPLAAVKLKGSDLPADVKLDDSMAMMPQLKLSGFDKVLVQARIAKGGKPIAQSGDLQSASVEVATSAQAAIALVINSEVP